MIKHQQLIYKLILGFSAVINLYLLGLLFIVLRDSISGSGEYRLEGKSFWYFTGIIAAFSIANSIALIHIFRTNSHIETQIQDSE